MLHSRSLSICALLMTIVGCKPKAPEKEKTTKGSADIQKLSSTNFITPSDLSKPHAVDYMTEDQLAKLIAQSGDFRPSQPKSDGDSQAPTEETEGCLARMKADTENNRVVFAMESSDRRCGLQIEGNLLNAASVKNFTQLSCSNKNFQKFDGKAMSEFTPKEIWKTCENSEVALTDRLKLTSVYTSKDTKEKWDLTIVTSTGSPQGGPCRRTLKNNVSTLVANCVSTYVRTGITRGNKSESYYHYERYTEKGLTHSLGDKFYRSGTIEFEIHNWTGMAKYSGASTPPTIVASNGTDTVHGVLGNSFESSMADYGYGDDFQYGGGEPETVQGDTGEYIPSGTAHYPTNSNSTGSNSTVITQDNGNTSSFNLKKNKRKSPIGSRKIGRTRFPFR